MQGYIRTYRKLLEWEWYTEPNTFRVFMHCLLKANHKDNTWRGHKIKKGSFITSYGNLAYELGLSKQNVRTALNNLKSTNEITVETTHHNTTINIVNWGLYQFDNNTTNTPSNTQDNKEVTHAQHTLNTGLTTNNNVFNVSNEKNEDKKEKDIVPYKEIVSYLNDKARTQYKSTTKKTQQLIKARFNESFTLEDFKTVIDIKTNEWLKDESMNKFLRPETLFGTKFESYLNQTNINGKTDAQKEKDNFYKSLNDKFDVENGV